MRSNAVSQCQSASLIKYKIWYYNNMTYMPHMCARAPGDNV